MLKMVHTDSQIEPAPQEVNGEGLTPGTNTAAMPDSTFTLADFGSCKASGGSRGGTRGGRPPSLFFYQNEARGTEKIFLEIT